MNILFMRIVEVSVNFFESAITLEYVIKMNETKYKGTKNYLALMITFLLLTINAELLNYMPYFLEIMLFTGLIIITLYSILFLEGSILRKLFSCLTILFVIVIVNLFATISFSLIFGINIGELMNEFSIYRLACLMISKIILFVVTRILLNFKTKYISNFPTAMIALAIAVPVLTIAVMIIITEASVNLMPNDRNTFYLFLSLIGMIVINIVFYALLSRLDRDYKLQTENKLLKQKDSLQLEYIKRSNILYKEIRIMRHDMKNQIIYLQDFFSEGRYPQGIAYADNMINKINNLQKLIYTGRMAFDAILNAKLYEATAKGISFEYKILCSLENRMEDDDMVSLLGNVIDNAIEACEHVKGKKRIQFEVKREQAYLIFIVKNSIENSVLKDNPKLKTTKNDKGIHGLGIKSIKKIVEKYDGFVNNDEKDNEFICKIMILI